MDVGAECVAILPGGHYTGRDSRQILDHSHPDLPLIYHVNYEAGYLTYETSTPYSSPVGAIACGRPWFIPGPGEEYTVP